MTSPANPKAPTAAELASMTALIDAKHAALAATTTAVVPLSGCGVNSYADLLWTVENIVFYSQVWWYRTSDCSLVYLDTGYLGPGSIPSSQLWSWVQDAYYTDIWTAPFEWDFLQSYGTYSYSINRSEAPQHWYRQRTEHVDSYTFYFTYVAVCN
ncbi:MAG TPA: hypothetical protein VGR57_04530 [Ktedonobacterales bacterium]|nr:hypothetical protein [Ktedonobacterales bacterium]